MVWSEPINAPKNPPSSAPKGANVIEMPTIEPIAMPNSLAGTFNCTIV